MNPCQVLLIGKDNLFTDGLENLLIKRFNHGVKRVCLADSYLLVEEIWQTQPQIIIMNTLYLSQPLEIFAQLKPCHPIQLIVVNEYNNTIFIYERNNSLHLLPNSGKANAQTKLCG